MKILNSLLLLFALLLSVNLNAEEDPVNAYPAVIYGNVFDKQTEKAVEYANIGLYMTADSSLINGTISDSTGLFVLQLAYGEFYISVDFIGYEKIIIDNIIVDKAHKEINLGKIELSQAHVNLEGFEVVGDRSYIEMQADKQIVHVEKHDNAIGGTAIDALQNVPSVTIDSEGNVQLKGSPAFTLLINGRPSVMDANDALKQIPAANIDRIEIITNPSAKYDPEGTTGIINLILKKNLNDGINGIVNVRLGTQHKYRGDATINYRKGRINYFIGGDIMWDNYYAVSNDYSERCSNPTTYITTEFDRHHINSPWSARGGFDFEINDNNSLSVSSQIGQYVSSYFFDTKIHQWDTSGIDNHIFSKNHHDVIGMYQVATLNWKKKFSETSEIVFDLYYSRWDGDGVDSITNYTTDGLYESLSIDTLHASDIMALQQKIIFKADYTKVFKNKSSLETGYHFRYLTHDGSFDYYDSGANQTIWTINNDFTNSMHFYRMINAAYITYGSSFKGFNYRLGLRGEHVLREMTQETTNEITKKNIPGIYPSLHISRKLKNDQMLNLSYSKRIRRPHPYFLNPFMKYNDGYTIMFGNPDLLPENTHSFELGYQKTKGNDFLSLKSYFYYIENRLDRIATINNEGQLLLMHENLDEQTNAGFELMINKGIGKNFNFNFTTNGFYQQVESNISGLDYTDHTFVYAFNLATGIRTKFVRGQILLNYTGPSLDGQSRTKANFVSNLSLRSDFMQKKLTVALIVQDIFNTSKYSIITDDPSFYMEFDYVGKAPTVFLSLSYKINNFKPRKDVETDFQGGGGI
jgi:outer membrane receptor protein involved in Fe transport